MVMSGVFLAPELVLHPAKDKRGSSGKETHKEPEEVESLLEEALADNKACKERLKA